MKTNNWIEQIDKTTNGFRESFGHLTDEQMNWKPDKHTWGIAQNIAHLIMINESYFPVLDSLRKGTYQKSFLGKFGFIVDIMGKTLLKAVQPDRKRKTKTFSMWEPDYKMAYTDILNKFEKHQKALKREIEDSKSLLERGAVVSSPANKNIVYRLSSAFDIMVTHEKRHLEQAKEILEILLMERQKFQ